RTTGRRWVRLMVPGLLACAALAALAATACFPVPLGDPEQSKVDERLRGYWLDVTEGSTDHSAFAVAPFDAHAYVIQAVNFTKSDAGEVKPEPAIVFKAWLSEVKGRQFLTAQPLTGMVDPKAKPGFFIVKVDVSDGKVVLHPLAGSPPFSTAADAA